MGWFLLLLLVGVSNPYTFTEDFSPEVTQWPDESDMRLRMAGYAREKFEHHYYWNLTDSIKPGGSSPSRNALRGKRDGGSITGTVLATVVAGVIGMAAEFSERDDVHFQMHMSQGGCTWFGTSPLCITSCPADHDHIRSSNGRCSNWWLSGMCVPDESFGMPCSTLLGGILQKRFCCKADPGECTWSGRWMAANTGHNVYCRYDPADGRCGSLHCSINHFTLRASQSVVIYGNRCDKLHIFGYTGQATCGYIAWYNQQGEAFNSWYKTRSI